MGLWTNLTRMWLTRSMKPFSFTQKTLPLDYTNENNLGLYIHIPFCKSICSFCPYCKEIYNKDRMNRYIDALLSEIHMVGSSAQYKEKKKVTSLYFGGGTPALAADRLQEIIDTISMYFDIQDGIGLELHPENVTVDTLKILKTAGVTKVSIGIQSFSEKQLQTLGRSCFDASEMFDALQRVTFETVSMDFIFALPGQNIEDLKKDIETAFSNGANHIAVYPFIDFDFTSSPVQAMDPKTKHKLMDQLADFCRNKGYRRDSIWTFAKDEHAGYSSMTRDNFLGFGCSATTLLKDQFKINTFSVDAYINKIQNSMPSTSLTIAFTKRQRMVYYLFWTAYGMHVSADDFERFFGVPLHKMYGFEFALAKLLGLIEKKGRIYQLTDKGAFYFHYYENFYTLSYIDKMWGLMKDEAFPKGMEL